MQVAAREGRPVIGDTLEIAFADGRTKVIHGNAAPLFDEDGRPRGAIGAFMDMTEWRRVEAALADSEERLRLAVQANGLGLFDRDLTGNILRWSARTKEIFGLPPDASHHVRSVPLPDPPGGPREDPHGRRTRPGSRGRRGL